jgi:hypothetical protein
MKRFFAKSSNLIWTILKIIFSRKTFVFKVISKIVVEFYILMITISFNFNVLRIWISIFMILRTISNIVARAFWVIIVNVWTRFFLIRTIVFLELCSRVVSNFHDTQRVIKDLIEFVIFWSIEVFLILIIWRLCREILDWFSLDRFVFRIFLRYWFKKFY